MNKKPVVIEKIGPTTVTAKYYYYEEGEPHNYYDMKRTNKKDFVENVLQNAPERTRKIAESTLMASVYKNKMRKKKLRCKLGFHSLTVFGYSMDRVFITCIYCEHHFWKEDKVATKKMYKFCQEYDSRKEKIKRFLAACIE